MKRIGYLYEKICDKDTLNKALDQAVKGKREQPFARRILARRDYYIDKLHEILVTESFIPHKGITRRIVEQPRNKERLISVPRLYPDHVIHWAICIALNKTFMKGMYDHCVGSVPGRGNGAGRKHIEKILKKGKVKYVLKMDVRKFFQHIDHTKIEELLARKIKDKKALRLISQVIDNGGDGLPIGYYTSQWLSNFYLEKVDHYIKEELKIKYYVRNVDDMVLADTNKRKLHKAKRKLDEELKDYNLEIKPDWQLWKVGSRPIDFLGYRFYGYKTTLRKNNFYRFMRRVRRVKKKGYCTVHGARSIASGLGDFKHLPCGRHFYLNSVKPIIRKRDISKIISCADRRLKERRKPQ